MTDTRHRTPARATSEPSPSDRRRSAATEGPRRRGGPVLVLLERPEREVLDHLYRLDLRSHPPTDRAPR